MPFFFLCNYGFFQLKSKKFLKKKEVNKLRHDFFSLFLSPKKWQKFPYYTYRSLHKCSFLLLAFPSHFRSSSKIKLDKMLQSSLFDCFFFLPKVFSNFF